ncbi:MAG: DNA alkylation repair protein [Paludibacter sp.]|nr:DNA alkylation repair protein [Paludibacter sp.]
MQTVEIILEELKSMSNDAFKEKLKHFGIENEQALGIRIPELRALAKTIGKNTDLAQELWKINIHEAKLLAAFIVNPKELTEADIDQWVQDFNSWDICDQTCNAISATPLAEKLIFKYVASEEEFVRRTAFVLMCTQAVHNRELPDNEFYKYFALIEQYAWDNRNFVRKAVNWALRQIGKRNLHLHEKSIETAERIKLQDSGSAKWIAADALRELNDPKIIRRMTNKKM